MDKLSLTIQCFFGCGHTLTVKDFLDVHRWECYAAWKKENPGKQAHFCPRFGLHMFNTQDYNKHGCDKCFLPDDLYLTLDLVEGEDPSAGINSFMPRDRKGIDGSGVPREYHGNDYDEFGDESVG